MGRAALDALIFELVRDKEWLPGELHKALVGLPWTDFLTTIWDTLIERAGYYADQSYESVRAVTDIPRTRSPRIVKAAREYAIQPAVHIYGGGLPHLP